MGIQSLQNTGTKRGYIAVAEFFMCYAPVIIYLLAYISCFTIHSRRVLPFIVYITFIESIIIPAILVRSSWVNHSKHMLLFFSTFITVL